MSSSGGPRPQVITVPGFAPVHGFTTRHEGVSSGPYASLNLGLSSGDERARVEANRDLVLAHLGAQRSQVCAFDQVHGKRVLVASASWFEHEADAAVSEDPALLLVVSGADCPSLLFHDPVSGAVGAAHAGWRGTLAGIAGEVVTALEHEYGARAADLSVIIGPGIGACCYEVSHDVAERFGAAGFAPECIVPGSGVKPHLDLVRANVDVLERAGVPASSIRSLGLCTSCLTDSFYSHRRDAGITGRSWGYVRATGPRDAASDQAPARR